MNLIIVESPTKGKTIQKFLGPNYKVLSSYGHIRDLPTSKLGVDVEKDFEPSYIIPAKARKTIKLLKENSKKAESTIIATDEDREGEAIAWHLAHALNLKDPKRIVFHEITRSAIEDALKNPRSIDIDLVDSQQARRILDRLVGYKLSPFLWKKIARGLSAGRVQSVAVRLVVEREREIQSFKAVEYLTINNKQLAEFNALLIKKNGKVIDKLEIKNKEEADKILKDLEGAEYKVVNVEKKEVNRNPLPPFTTSTLQQEAWKKFRYPAKFTMQIAQHLYEKGLTTYHRTDSVNLSNLALGTSKEFITKNYGQNYYQFRKFKTKSKGAQEAHEAIRPTYAAKRPEDLIASEKITKNHIKLYDLVWKRFIASQMSQARFDSTAVDIEAENPKSEARNPLAAKATPEGALQILNPKSEILKYTFRANGQTLKFDGFLKVYPVKFEENELPLLNINEILELIKINSEQHFTQPKARYNEASLVKALEENGIGRPSTYAPIISTIQERNYIEKNEEKRFRPTEIGTVVNDLLVQHFPEVVDIKFTAIMEEEFDKIADNKQEWVPVIKKFYEPFSKNLKEKYEEVSKKDFTEKKTDKICPECRAPLLIRLGKFGEFYACSKFPECKYAESLKKRVAIVDCPACKDGKIFEKRTKKGKIFYACSNWPKCDFALWDKPTGQICQTCGSLLIETKRKQIKCSNKTCGSTS